MGTINFRMRKAQGYNKKYMSQFEEVGLHFLHSKNI